MMNWLVWLLDYLGIARDPSRRLAVEDEPERDLARRLAALDATIGAQQRRKAREDHDHVR